MNFKVDSVAGELDSPGGFELALARCRELGIKKYTWSHTATAWICRRICCAG